MAFLSTSLCRAVIFVSYILTVCFLANETGLSPAMASENQPVTARIGVYDNPPKIFTDADGSVKGFWPELINHIAALEGWKVEYVQGSWGEGLSRLKDNTIDVMPDVAFTEERSRSYLFSKDAVLMSWSRVYVHRNNHDIEAYTDLQNKRIAGLAKSVNLDGSEGLKEIARVFNLNCTFLEFDSYQEAFRAVEDGRADAAITNRNFGESKARFYDVKRTAMIFQPISMKFAYTIDGPLTPLFRDRIDHHMGRLIQDDTSIYYQLLKNHFEGGVTEHVVEHMPRWITTFIEIAAVLGILFVVTIVVSRIQVKRKTLELKERNRAVEESERTYRLLVENQIDLVVKVDLEGKLLFVSPSYCEMFGKSEEELLGTSFVPLIHDDDREATLRAMEELYVPPHKAYMEQRAMTRNGWRWLAWADTAMLDENNEIVAIHGIGRDITDRKKMEEELRQLSHRQEVLLSAIPDIVVEIGTNRQIVWTNDAGYQFYGDEVLGKPLDHFLAEEQNGQDSLAPLFSGEKKLIRIDNLHRRRDGEKRSLSWRCRGLAHDGELSISGVLATARDITDILALRKQFQQAQRMESVGRLAGGVAHDFNNMLSVIIGHSELALDHVNPSMPIYEDLREIRKAALRSADLTRQLLAFARKQIIQPKVLDLNEAVSSALKMLQRLIGEDIKIIWKPGASLQPVKMDPSQIDQILVNMAVNSRDAIQGTGSVTFETENIDVDQEWCDRHPGTMPGRHVMLSISDDGSGMSKETKDSIFEPFFTTKEVGKGTGLGLATVYGIIRQNNGGITVYSEEGMGTVFKIFIPAVSAEPEATQTPSETPILSGGETVLVVEDEAATLNLVRALLKQYGYAVLAALSPEEALKVAEDHGGRIDLLLTDIIMPGMNGKMLMDKLSTVRKDLKVLYMSGYTIDTIEKHGVLDEGIHFIQKPFSNKALLAKLRAVLEQ